MGRKQWAAPVWAAVLWVLALLSVAPAWGRSQCLAIDGDTLYCAGQKIRLTNVYAAELNQAGGAAAKRRMAALLASGRVTLLRHGHDKYGRILAEVFVNGRRIEQSDIGPAAGRGLRNPNARRPYYVPRKDLRLHKNHAVNAYKPSSHALRPDSPRQRNLRH